MITIRAATVQDAAGIAHVHVQSWRTTYAGIVPQAYLDGLNEAERTLQWREWLVLPSPVFVAEAEAGIVGFVGGGAIREPLLDYDAELYAIYLLREAQGQRTGTALLKTMAAALSDWGFRSMIASVLRDNSSIKFYERSGACFLTSKEIEIGEAVLTAVAYGWRDLAACGSIESGSG